MDLVVITQGILFQANRENEQRRGRRTTSYVAICHASLFNEMFPGVKCRSTRSGESYRRTTEVSGGD